MVMVMMVLLRSRVAGLDYWIDRLSDRVWLRCVIVVDCISAARVNGTGPIAADGGYG